ncbi:MAG: hypothetical protein IIX01_04255, partial [Clostridia bacterium]|nr:hypothetical protein [Clostridia bacterium]
MPIKGGKCTEKQLAALRAGKKDFISGDERTREIQSQGTKAAVEKRTLQAQKRTFAQHLAEILSLETKEGKTRKNGIAEGLVSALEKELASKKPNGKTINALFVAVRDTLGEAPSQKIDLNANVKTIGNWRDVPKKMENEPPPGAAVECSSDCVSVPTEERATA